MKKKNHKIILYFCAIEVSQKQLNFFIIKMNIQIFPVFCWSNCHTNQCLLRERNVKIIFEAVHQLESSLGPDKSAFVN